MRSGSSLLVHVLNTNPQIIGFGETKTVYDGNDSLDQLLSKVSTFFDRKRLDEKYLLEKIVQDELITSDEILKRKDVRCIFLVRDAERTLPSITDMYTNIFPTLHENWTSGENEAFTYYRDRLNRLADIAESIPAENKSIVLTYSELLENTAATFELLRQALEIREPFKESYDMHKATGVAGIGDFSPEISKGVIIKDNPKSSFAVSQHLIDEGKVAYQEALQRLRKVCAHI